MPSAMVTRPSDFPRWIKASRKLRVARADLLGNKGPVDLQDVHRELPQVGQRGVSSPEVVDGYTDAKLWKAPPG